MKFPALFMEAKSPALSLGMVIFDPYADDRAQAGEAVYHDADEGPIPEPDDMRGVDAVEERPGFLRGEPRGFALFDHVFESPDIPTGFVGIT
jgi:hypothetical protein